MTANHGRRGRPWRRLRALVLASEPVCYLCKQARSTTVDHVLPLSKYPHLAHDPSNLRGCCGPCNYAKQDRMPGRPKPPPGVTDLKW